MKGILIGLIVFVVGALITNSLLSEKPAIIYTISGPISIEPSLRVQQLEMKNVGDKEAKAIRVKVHGTVAKYDIAKFSEADEPKVFSTTNSFELIYPSLPPEAVFKLTLTSPYSIVQMMDLSFQDGKATNAIERSDWSASTLASLILLILLAGVIAIYVWLEAVSLLESKPKYSYDNILRRRKPFYVSSTK